MTDLLKQIISHVAVFKLRRESDGDGALAHYKVVYDMARLIQRKYPQVISDEFKQSEEFQQLWALEETIGMFSSVSHFWYYDLGQLFPIHITSNAQLLETLAKRYKMDPDKRPIDFTWESDKFEDCKALLDPDGLTYMSDLMRKDRRISRFNLDANGRRVDREHETVAKLRRSQRFQGFLQHFERAASVCGREGKQFPQASKEIVEEQYLRYLVQLKKLKDIHNPASDSFSKTIEMLELIVLAKFDKYQKQLNLYLEEFPHFFRPL
ncbi:hypothetical protein PTTG_01639 [Puccinia triticina 1-1 BBBD Race 1]|uniref:Uncharacterized protein n=2 Tax=Puccinia triticina TaxID=208348 RepID=A0A0C4ELK5_PUCT1|nr:hypothetical protein PTTG_01639 [Puccinia triticina 1-1 BBBD Race 1]